MLIKDYKGDLVEADVVYAVPTDHGNDYVKLDFEELKCYAITNRKGYADVLASTSMINISDQMSHINLKEGDKQ